MKLTKRPLSYTFFISSKIDRLSFFFWYDSLSFFGLGFDFGGNSSHGMLRKGQQNSLDAWHVMVEA